MRKLILKMSMSLDGFVAGPNNELDWLFETMSPAGKAWTAERISEAGVHAMGSRTFHDMAAYWPTSRDVLAAPMNEIPKVVFSRRGKSAGQTTRALDDARASSPTPADAAHVESWNSARWLVGDLATEVAKLKAEGGKPIVAHGGASFARSLVALDLVDEYQLVVHPIAIGRGHGLFGERTTPARLVLASSTSFPAGTIANVYVRR
jgi:dihydrofolate reductase